MNKKFLQSVTTGLVGLSLAASCSQLGMKKDSHSCKSNSCAAKKKEEGNKCSSAKKVEMKKEANSCTSKEVKKEANSCSSKKAKKAAAKAAVKAEEKKN